MFGIPPLKAQNNNMFWTFWGSWPPRPPWLRLCTETYRLRFFQQPMLFPHLHHFCKVWDSRRITKDC